jgi:hypothetical protein
MRRVSTAAALLAQLVAMTLLVSACTGFTHPDPGEVSPAATGAAPPLVPPVVVSVDSVFTDRPVFGISLPDMTPQSLAAATTSAGCRPTVVNRFVSLVTGVSLSTLKSTLGIPMLSVEPWRPADGRQQSDFTLQKTVDGKWDAQYKQLAQTVVQYHEPILIRFAHEMNGDWYPWGTGNTNTPAAFVAAWRHVVDIFRQFGATNVLWVWSPNILRGASSTTIKQFWPGPDYVDIVGMTGYGVRESDVAQTFGPTLTQIEQLTDKPLMLTETGAQADAAKTQWLTSFGSWLKAHPKVLGFVWFESNRGDDWRFDDTAPNLTAFKKSLDTAKVSC